MQNARVDLIQEHDSLGRDRRLWEGADGSRDGRERLLNADTVVMQGIWRQDID